MYKLIKAKSITELVTAVNSSIEEGFNPVGQPIFVSVTYFVQSMFKSA